MSQEWRQDRRSRPKNRRKERKKDDFIQLSFLWTNVARKPDPLFVHNSDKCKCYASRAPEDEKRNRYLLHLSTLHALQIWVKSDRAPIKLPSSASAHGPSFGICLEDLLRRDYMPTEPTYARTASLGQNINPSFQMATKNNETSMVQVCSCSFPYFYTVPYPDYSITSKLFQQYCII